MGKLKKAIFIYLLIYFAANLVFLDTFPFMHSDESWLSGLTRAMMKGGPSVTEPFFDLFPRYPHAIKTIFHLLQMPFILVFGYNLFAVRLVSLLFGTAALYIFYRLALLLCKSELRALVITVLLSADVQYIYAAHFARQDIIIAFGMLCVIYYIISRSEAHTFRNDVVAGAITGVFIGVHPNSLIIALCAGSVYLYYIFTKTLRLKNLLTLVLTVSLFAAVFIGASYAMNGDFFEDYMNYGSELGAGLPIGEKISMLPQFYEKLYLQVSATYYTPPIRLQIIVFAVGAAAGAVLALRRREVLKLLLPVFAVNAGFVLIGRYSQPGVILVFPLCYLLVFYIIDSLLKRYRLAPALLAGAALIATTAISAAPYINNGYRDYLSRIRSSVPAQSRTLANINCGYAFEQGRVLDYRNLEFLDGSGLKFEEYIDTRGIEYIVYPQEMDFIYENRPVWNILYGNLYPYYADMKRFLSERCLKVNEFHSPYAMRIAGMMYGRDWSVEVYSVQREEKNEYSF